jgi:uncharacterized protein DUF4038/collagenase-like protein with putative collagen-binding domain
MPRSRGRGSKWWAAATIAGLAAACSGSSNPGGGADGGIGDGGSLPGFDAAPPMGLFPLGVSGDGGSLVTADGKPFLLHAEAAWSLIAQPDTAGAMQYLADRHRRGVQAVLVNLIEHLYADNAPANAAGDAPFTTPGDFSKPNEAYFAHADQVIDLAASQGIAVLLVPSYLGFNAGNEGWFQEMSGLSATQCRSYGDFVGQRYASRHNIIWVWGGDYTPPTGSPGETCMKSIRDGILAAEPGVLATAHWQPESTSGDEPAFASSINLVGVYTYMLDQEKQKCATARSATPRKPAFLIETCYEGETIRSCPNTPADIRRRQWWAFLACGAGEIVGNNPIWKFGDDWPKQLASPASTGEQRLAAIAGMVAWQTLAPAGALVTAGQAPAGNDQELAIARTADHKQAVIYVPATGASTITVDLSQMTGLVTAIWQDPTADHSVAAGDGLTSNSQVFKTPGNGLNNGGDHDWVLVLTAP